MKPIVYYDFKEINDEDVSIGKKRLQEILEEVYQAGYVDGNNSNNKSYITTTPFSPIYGSNITCCDAKA